MKRSVMEFDVLVDHDLERGKQSFAGNMDRSVLLMVDDSEHRKADRRKADLALQKSEERYRAFVEHSSEAVWCVDIEPPCSIKLSVDAQIDHFYEHGYLAECNDVMAQMFGFSDAAKIVGVRMSHLLPRSRPENREYLMAFIQSNYRLADKELQELDKDGNTKCFLNNLVGIIGGGAVARVWGTKRDSTARKEAENALIESRLRMLCAKAKSVMSSWSNSLRMQSLSIRMVTSPFAIRPQRSSSAPLQRKS